MSTFLIALILFVITYILLFTLPKWRHFVALGSAVVFSLWLSLICKDVDFTFKNIISAIDFNVLMMIAGTMGIVVLFIDSKMPMSMAEFILSKFRNVKWAIIAMSLLSGIISAFVDNVATVLMIAPIALAVCKKQNISPIAPIICITVSSNLQGAATLVGDTTSILLAGYANMNFFDFFIFNGRPGIFFAVEIGALLTIVILAILFRKETKELKLTDKTKVTDYVPTFLMLGVIVLLITASFIKEPKSEVLKSVYNLRNGLICLSLLIVGIIINLIKTKKTTLAKEVFKEIDYKTLLLLASLFVVIEAIASAGLISKLSELLVSFGGSNLLSMYAIIVIASVLISAFVDNIPYVLTMLPVVSAVSLEMGVEPYILYFGLLIGATLGGNITPIGASANITGIGILAKEGYTVKTKEFMKISVPFTITAVVSGALSILLFYM